MYSNLSLEFGRPPYSNCPEGPLTTAAAAIELPRQADSHPIFLTSRTDSSPQPQQSFAPLDPDVTAPVIVVTRASVPVITRAPEAHLWN